MNFIFTITAHGFDKAAKLELELKKLDIPYEVKQSQGPHRKRTRKVLSKTEVMAVAIAIQKHPDRPTRDIAKETGVSHATINRIRNGTHPLLANSNVKPMGQKAK